MKIAKQQLKKMIKEELTAVLNEREITYGPTGKRMTLPDDPLEGVLPTPESALEWAAATHDGKNIKAAIKAVTDSKGDGHGRYSKEELQSRLVWARDEMGKILNHFDRVAPEGYADALRVAWNKILGDPQEADIKEGHYDYSCPEGQEFYKWPNKPGGYCRKKTN